ncbi:hypothetical protein GA0070606_1955 [Micromonospora citrea]|uniref:Uncharacterized protein n=1 Tax=Micromonospora citrea TaxID=47855 RepID=A0A1C6UEA7_9ACTN|nr:hypothetical protein GA0070606_1955 [Micromonospora citrea]
MPECPCHDLACRNRAGRTFLPARRAGPVGVPGPVGRGRPRVVPIGPERPVASRPVGGAPAGQAGTAVTTMLSRYLRAFASNGPPQVIRVSRGLPSRAK